MLANSKERETVMKYTYCTKRMSERAAKKGLESAIDCSRDKWLFFGNCDEKQISRISPAKLGMNCSLCKFSVIGTHSSISICPRCLLKKHCTNSYDPSFTYWQAYDLYKSYKERPTKTCFKKFQAKARELARLIGRLK